MLKQFGTWVLIVIGGVLLILSFWVREQPAPTEHKQNTNIYLTGV